MGFAESFECIVYTLDLPCDDDRNVKRAEANSADANLIDAAEPGIEFGHSDVANKIRQLDGDSTNFDFSPYKQSVDLVYIDGAHHYEGVSSDTKNASYPIQHALIDAQVQVEQNTPMSNLPICY